MTTLPKSVELKRTDKSSINHEYGWFVVPTDDHLPIFSSLQAGDAGCKSCLTWLANNGYRQKSEQYPESEIYVRD